MVNTKRLEFIDLLLLDRVYLFSLFLDLGSYFLSFFEVVKSGLFGNIFILVDLLSNLYGVNLESLLFSLFDSFLLGFNLFLLLNLGHVVLFLDFSLLGEILLLFGKLSLPCNLKISLDSFSLKLFKSFSFSGLSLSLFEGSLGSQGIDFSLSISSLLLEFSESLDFFLLLLFDSLSFLGGFIFLLVSCLLVSNNLLFLSLLFLSSLFLLKE
jgi:hypothetical protein